MTSVSSQKNSEKSFRRTTQQQKPKRAGIVGIDETVHINTDVFIKPGVLQVPEEFFRKGKNRPKPPSKITISLNRSKGGRNKETKSKEEMSAFEARWNYDDKMRGDGANVKAPSTVDYFKVKIDQREKYFKELML